MGRLPEPEGLYEFYQHLHVRRAPRRWWTYVAGISANCAVGFAAEQSSKGLDLQIVVPGTAPQGNRNLCEADVRAKSGTTAS